MVEQSGTALLLEQICNHHEDKIMPLGAFKAALMGTAGVSTAGDVVLLHDQDYSGASEAVINSGIDSTYGEYIFKFYNINPTTDKAEFEFQCNATDSDSYDETMTTTAFHAAHKEDGSYTNLSYLTAEDQAQGTAYQMIGRDQGNAADESVSGELHLFNPSSTTYVKHWYSRANGVNAGLTPHYSSANFCAGYINTTTAIDDIQFKMDSGNFDGTIKMWGVK